MIDKICQYSVIILVGNLVVLQIVAIATDYWEYRSFNIDKIKPMLEKSNRTKIDDPKDTSSYIAISYLHDDHAKFSNVDKYIGNKTDYQSPAYIRRFYQPQIVRTNVSTDVVLKEVMDLVVLFEQYGNLFRDCDNLEGKSLGLKSSTCLTFLGILSHEVLHSMFSSLFSLVFYVYLLLYVCLFKLVS
jgi:hypothetical protein